MIEFSGSDQLESWLPAAVPAGCRSSNQQPKALAAMGAGTSQYAER